MRRQTESLTPTMLGFGSKKPLPPTSEAGDAQREQEAPHAAPEGGKRLFGRLRGALARTRAQLVGGLSGLVGRSARIDEALLEEVETVLLSADVGIEATRSLIAGLERRRKRKELDDSRVLFDALRADMVELLRPCSAPLRIDKADGAPFVVLVVGVNGSGKTTTIGKLAARLRREGLSVMLAAGDTFRAAAVEQLQRWGKRIEVPVIAQHTGADSASVVYDALAAARARGFDVLIADTAGRLHTQTGLMEELRKVRRVLAKLDPSAPHETLLVLDAGTGQNGLVQARRFGEAVQVSGLALTKLDGTARGGVVFAIAATLGIPIRFLGVGEQSGDLRDFDAEEFVDDLLAREPEKH